MTVIKNVGLVLKDSKGNEGIVKTFTDKDINKISNAITDVGQVVDPVTHTPIEATKTSTGVVQLATAEDITNGTAGKVVDAQELNNFAQTLPSVNGITDVSSGDNSNQIVVSKFGGSKTLTIDNVEHASNADEATHASQADTATSANSVAWSNVQDKPSSFNPSSHTHDDRYYTESEIDTKLSGKYNTSGLGSTTFKVTRSASISTATHGYWSAMCNSTQTGSPTLPTSSNWWHVISMDWTDDTKNWVSQLAVATQDSEGVYWRKNNAGGTEINSSTWHRLIDDSNIGSQSVNYANSAGSVAWNNVSGKPTIPSNTNQLTNGAGFITSSGSCNYSNYSGYVQGDKSTGLYINSVKYGGALVTTNQAGFGAIFNAPTKNNRIACATYPNNDDNLIFYSITNANVASSTNTPNKIMTWNGNTGILTANGFSGPLTGNVTGNCSGTAATISQKVDANAKTHTNYSTNGTYVPTMNFLSFWNGAYNSGGASNLTYCAQGTIIGSSNIGSQSVNYAKSAGAVAWANVSGRPDIWIG